MPKFFSIVVVYSYAFFVDIKGKLREIFKGFRFFLAKRKKKKTKWRAKLERIFEFFCLLLFFWRLVSDFRVSWTRLARIKTSETHSQTRNARNINKFQKKLNKKKLLNGLKFKFKGFFLLNQQQKNKPEISFDDEKSSAGHNNIFFRMKLVYYRL